MTWIVQVIVVHGGSIQNILQDVIFVWGNNGFFIALFVICQTVSVSLVWGGVVGLDPTCVCLVLFEFFL